MSSWAKSTDPSVVEKKWEFFDARRMSTATHEGYKTVRVAAGSVMADFDTDLLWRITGRTDFEGMKMAVPSPANPVLKLHGFVFAPMAFANDRGRVPDA